MSKSPEHSLPTDKSEDTLRQTEASSYSTLVNASEVRSIRHLPLWRDNDIQRNIELVLDDPLFNLTRRLLAFETRLDQLSAEGATIADEALALLAGMKSQLRGAVTKSAVRTYVLAMPFLAFTRTYARLNRLAKTGPTRAKAEGKDYPPQMALPDYGLTCPSIPDGAYYPERTIIENPLVDAFVRFTANDVMLFLEGRKKAEKALKSESDKEERRLRVEYGIGKKPKRPSSRKRSSPTVDSSAATQSPLPDVGVSSEGVVSKITVSKRSTKIPASSHRRPRLPLAGIPPRWRDLDDEDKYRVICEAFHAETSGIAITVHIDLSWMESRRAAGKDVMSEIQQRLSKAFRHIVGPRIGFASVLEADRLTDPHLHGVVNLLPTPENRERVRKALLRFTGGTGLDGRVRARRVDERPISEPLGWAEYPFERPGTARKIAGTHRVLLTSRPAVQLGRALQEQRRAVALSTPA